MLTANVLCLKKKKKRTYCLSSASNCRGYGAGTSKNERSRGGTVTMMQITEDTPPDMLAGAMDLSVHLPNGKTVKMSVERSTPMMDLLVQITTAHHLQLSNHTLQVLGMAPSSEHSDKVLPFKPNTPIGTLDTQHIRILPKGRTLPAPKYQAPGHQPFESTFRLKVHLPRNQLYVTRVSRNVLLEDIMKKVCEEKNLDPLKYEFKHPGNLDEVLDPKLTLSDYQITEIYVVAKGTTNPSQVFSAADIMVLRKEEERKQMHNKTGGGVFNLIFKRGKSSMGSGSISSDNRSISPTHSDDSRSVTPPAVQAPPIVGPPKKDPPPDRPKPPQRKRRPAPKPPQIHVEAEASKSGDCSALVSDEIASSNATSKKAGVAGENCLTICHSRNSSDSSGYHEASILSDHCANASLPRNRPKSAFVGDSVTLQGTSNLNKMALHSRSTTSLVAGRKKKAAPPPPPVAVSPANSVVAHSDKPSPLVASQPDISTPPESVISPAQTPHDSIPPFPLDSSTPVKQPLQQEEKSLDSTDSGIAQDANSERGGKEEDDFGFHTPLPPPILDDISSDGVVKDPPSDKGIEDGAVPPPPPLTPPPTIAAGIKTVASSLLGTISKPAETETELVDIDWQYQLPSPPKAFRDSSPTNLIANETNSVSDFKDSVVTSPELFEKLRTLEDYPSVKSEAGTSIASEEPLNTLSLEHLEKRQSLVYNRELATSLKMTDNIETSGKTTETFASSLTGFQMDNKASPAPKQPPKPARATVATSNHHTLPNFQITTYDVPKHKNIKVFEDDTIRSNTHGSTTNLETKTEIGSSMENVSYTKRKSVGEEKEYHFYKPKPVQTGYSVSRSGSFSTDNRSSPSKPVSRSKSTLTLNKYHVGKRDENNISRSNSLFDVSGLQSLEVMRLIQNKLNSPPDSTENVSAPVEEKPKAPSPEPVKKYYYRGPPAVNMSTWSERPKVPVAVKEDEDYKLGNTRNLSSKLIVNTTNNNVTSNNSVEVKNGGHAHHVSVNVNGTEQITQKSGNVVIKIGSKNLDNQRFLGPVAYRKPFASINSNGRPHSIAVPSDFDMSRVPVVRSVEFKKSYKDQHGSNTSITHLNQGTDDDFKSLNHYYEKSDSFAEKFRSSENLRSIEKQESEPGKRVFRVGSFKPQENHVTPTVRGFKSNNNDINNRLSWNNNTLPTKPKLERDYTPNQHVPFSQSTLRRTGSNKIYAADQNSNDISKPERIVIPPETNSYNSLPPNFNKPKIVPPPQPPAAPQMPKVTLRKTLIAPSQSNSPADARGLLLESIKNFGGKKGLKTAKA